VRRAVSVLGSKCLNPIPRLPDALKSMRRLDKGSEIAYSFPPPCWKSNPARYSPQRSTKSAQRLSNTIWTENAMAEHVNARDNQVDRRTMIVGPGMAFTGEIASCDRLIVEGSIDASLPKCQHVIIEETGLFNGHASTDNADVHGRFQGELVVRKRLLIRAGGHVSGNITYGEIEIESGGTISGTIEVVGAANPVSLPFPMSA
jgi:cytoskeletal protein CcmA (bactofilin family)